MQKASAFLDAVKTPFLLSLQGRLLSCYKWKSLFWS